MNDFERFMRAELVRLDADEQAIRDLGDGKQLARMQKKIATMRRHIERALEQLPARRAAADARAGALLRGAVEALEQHVDGA